MTGDSEILLIVPSLDFKKWKGLGRYSFYLYNTLIKKFDVDVIEVQEPKKNYFRAILKSIKAGSFSKYRVVQSVSPELLFFRNLNRYKSKKIITIHDFIPFFEDTLSTSFKSLLLMLYKLNIRDCDLVISNSTLTSKTLFNLLGRNSYVIHPPVDLDLFKFKKKKIGNKIVLSFISNFSFRKRADIAIRVCSLLQENVDCKLVLAGGRLKNSYQRHFDVEKLIKQNRVRDFEIHEEIDDKLLIRIYQKSHFFIFPSTIEGFGIPVIEASACGTPTLLLKSSIMPKEVKKAGIECIDEFDMVKKILKLIDNKEEYYSFQQYCRSYSERFSLEIFKEKYIKIYESLL